MHIFLVTFGIASSMTASAIYLIFYPISEKLKRRLETVNLQFILVMGYCLLYAFTASEWSIKHPLVFYFLFLTVLFLVASLILIEYEDFRLYVLIGSLVLLGLILIIDMAAFATKR